MKASPAAGSEARAAWITAAMRALRSEGVAAVRVERLAAALGITKGSFYWHFTNRDELLDAVLEYWSLEMTEIEFARVAATDAGLAARLRALCEDVLVKGVGRYDPAIRAWGRTDARVAQLVAQVDRRRLRVLAGFFEDGGFDAGEARTRARLLYAFLLGEPQIGGERRASGELGRIVAVLSR